MSPCHCQNPFPAIARLFRRALGLHVLVLGLLTSGAAASTLDIQDRTITRASLSNTTVTMTGRSELHLTATGDPFPGCVIHLNSPDAWLFVDETRPFTFNGSYLGRIRVNGASANTSTNVRVVQHGMGTLVIPHGPSFTPLTIFSGTRRTGSSMNVPLYTYHQNAQLGALAGNVRSFRLKRGYMATMASNENGTGPGKVFIAQDDDIDVTEMPADLGHSIRFIRVFPWRWVAKKGWAGAGTDPATVDAAWFYNWNNNENSFFNREYVPIRQTRWWPDYNVTNSKHNVTHFLGFNEPDSPDQANMTVAQAIAEWPNLMRSGLRLGSPAPTDGGLEWLYQFIDEADALGYRVDYVAVHFYKGGWNADQLYNWLEQIHIRTRRPLWITEFNNGANWTCCAPSSHTQNGTIIKSFIERMDGAPFVERYAIYNWLNGNREMIVDGNLTTAGVVYRDHKSPNGYRDAPPQRPSSIYDEQIIQANVVDQEMSFSSNTNWTTGIGETLGAAQVIPLAQFKTRLAAAAANGFGGVVDFERGALHGGSTTDGQGFTAMFDDGRKSVDFTNRSGNGGSYSIGNSVANRTPVSGERYLSRSGNANFDFDVGNQRGFVRNERVVAAGATVLGRNDVSGSNFFRFTAWYSNGTQTGSTSLRRQINTSTGGGAADTFAAVAAPPGYWITRVTVTSENGVFTSVDDLAFITSLEPEFLWAPGGTIGGSGVWDNTTTSWTNGEQAMVWPGGRAATFAAPAGSINVGAAMGNVRDLIFETAGYTLAGGGSLNFESSPVIQVPTGTTTLQTALGGTAPAKTGPGTLVFAGANTFSPGTWIFGSNNTDHGHVRLSHAGALGGISLVRLRGSQGTAVSGIELTGGHSFSQPLETWGRLDPGGNGFVLRNLSGNNTWNGDITIFDGGGSYGFVSDAGRLTLGGRVTSSFMHSSLGARGVAIHGAGEMRIAGRLVDGTGGSNNSLRLAVTKNDGGLLSFAPGSEMNVQSFAFHAGSLSIDSPINFAAGAMVLNATIPVAVTGDVSFAFPLSGQGTVSKTGGGRLTLAGSNTFGPMDGALVLGSGTANAGIFRLAHPQALGNHTKVVLGSGQGGISGLELSGGHTFTAVLETIGRSNATTTGFALRNVSGNNTWNGPITITSSGGNYGILSDAGTLTLTREISSSIASSQFGARSIQFGGAGDIAVTGMLRRSGAFTMQDLNVTKIGSGTCTLAAGGDYAGATTITEGTLRVNGTLSASAVNVQPGGTLSGNGSIAAATVQGRLVLQIGQTFNIVGSLALQGGTLEISGVPVGVQPMILATYGTMSGEFSSVLGLPAGWRFDPDHAGGTAIAIVPAGFDSWAATHLGGQGPEASFHEDGIPNLLRYALDIDPAKPSGFPGSFDNGTITFNKRAEAVANGDVGYAIQTSATLATDSWTTVTPDINNAIKISYTLPAGHGQLFARLVVRALP